MSQEIYRNVYTTPAVALENDTRRYMADATTVDEFTNALTNLLTQAKNGVVDFDYFLGSNDEAWIAIHITKLKNGTHEIVIEKEDEEIEEMILNLREGASRQVIVEAIRKHW